MRGTGRCQEAPGRAAVGKDLPAAISALQHSLPRGAVLAALKMMGELAPSGRQLEREEEASPSLFSYQFCVRSCFHLW